MSTPPATPSSTGRRRGSLATPATRSAISTSQPVGDAMTSPLQHTQRTSLPTTAEPPQLPASTVGAVSIKLPPFWPNDPQLWFAQCEAQFTTRQITRETTKFAHVVSSLSHDFAHEVRDTLLNPPQENPYTTLKQELVSRLCASHQKRLWQLLTEEQLSDRKPSQFLRHLQQLQGDTPVDGLQELFLQRLPSHVCLVLATATDLSIDQQARLADNLMEISSMQPSQSHVSASETVDPLSDVSALRADIASLRQELGRRGPPSEQARHSRRQSRSPGRSWPCSQQRGAPESTDPSVYWYHQRFGDQARHCTTPCSHQGNDPSSR